MQAGLHAWLGTDSEFELICVCRDHAEVVGAAEKFRPALILYTFRTDADLDVMMEVRRVAPQSAVVLWSHDFSAELAHQMVEMGVKGLLSTTALPETVKKCLRTSAGGELWMERSLTATLLNARPINLTRRQTQLLRLLVQGLKNREIAASLEISEGTVKAYLTTLFEKVGAKDRFELALFGLKNLRNIRESGDQEMAVPSRSLVARRSVRRLGA
jgi:DNA-binding NarL/FixJ family response regulator